jgi:hypothetical protein
MTLWRLHPWLSLVNRAKSEGHACHPAEKQRKWGFTGLLSGRQRDLLPQPVGDGPENDWGHRLFELLNEVGHVGARAA